MEKEQKEAENAPGYSQEYQAEMVGCSQHMSEWTKLQPRKQTEYFGYINAVKRKAAKISSNLGYKRAPKHTKTHLSIQALFGDSWRQLFARVWWF